MMISEGFSITKPVALWNREIKTDFKRFFLNLAAGGVNLAVHDWGNASQHAQAALSAIGLDTDDCGVQAWLLIHRALTEAVFNLAKESAAHFQHAIPNPDLFGATLDQELEKQPVRLSHHFFSHPESLPLLGALQEALKSWLEAGGHDPFQARCTAQRLPSYFVLALNNQWRKQPNAYVCLQERVATPFTRAAARQQSWTHYRAWLQKQVNEPLCEESFSLRDLYVPLRGYYEEWLRPAIDTDDAVAGRHVVVELQTVLYDWLHNARQRDAVRILCGEPGSGKSSFVKMFAARIAAEGHLPLLLIPMHILPHQVTLASAVQAFVASDPCFKGYNPLHDEHDEKRLLIVFDGLDELAMQGERATDTARHFVEDVLRTTAQFNQRTVCLQVLMTERATLCATRFDLLRLPGQRLHLLSYRPVTTFHLPLHDPQRLLERDQRQLWWLAYGWATGKGYLAMPSVLDTPLLAETTAQPLLNYLVAVSVRDAPLEQAREATLHGLYRELFSVVFKRPYEGGRNPFTKGFDEAGFVRILEEIAVTVWHSRNRTTTVHAIEQRCRASGQHPWLDAFQLGAREGILRLLTAFYFRKIDSGQGGEERFTLTHHGFADYLLARRMVRLIRQLADNVRLFHSHSEKGWDESMALIKWVEICGPSRLDETRFAFICREVALYPKKKVRAWQKQLSRLIAYLLNNGLPMVKLGLVTYKEMVEQAHHAESALLAALNACARHSGARSPSFLEDITAMGAWLGRLQGQRTDDDPGVLAWLSHLDLSGSMLAWRDLCGANLQNSDLRRADLRFANLAHTDLRGTDLRGVDLTHVNLAGACLHDPNVAKPV